MPGIYSLGLRCQFDKRCFFEKGTYIPNREEFDILQRLYDHLQTHIDVPLQPLNTVIRCQTTKLKRLLRFTVEPLKFDVKIESYDRVNIKHRLVLFHN